MKIKKVNNYILLILIILFSPNASIGDFTSATVTYENQKLDLSKVSNIEKIYSSGLPITIIDFYAVVDYYYYSDFGGNTNAIESDILSVISSSNQLFASNGIPVVINLVNITYFSDFTEDTNTFGDPYSIYPSTLVANVLNYRTSRPELVSTDILMLFSGRTSVQAAGNAYISSPLNARFTSFITVTVGNIFTHILGHNFGARHDGDGNSCVSLDYIMAAYNNTATEFSTCSKNDILSTLAGIYGYIETDDPIILENNNTLKVEG